jgi:hypothetical protein
MARTTVWAFQPLKELDGKTGFVECDTGLASDLIAAGRAQDPKNGALCLKQITRKPEEAAEEAAPMHQRATYDTKVLTPEKHGQSSSHKAPESHGQSTPHKAPEHHTQGTPHKAQEVHAPSAPHKPRKADEDD